MLRHLDPTAESAFIGPPRRKRSQNRVVAAPVTTGRKATTSARTVAFRKRFFPQATEREWNDWRWQSQNRIRTLAQFEAMLRLTDSERNGLTGGGKLLAVGVTPYYMSLLDAENADQPLRRTVVPREEEFLRSPGEADDPLGEDGHSPVPGLVHRYPDRVLLLALDFCSTYCRYCTRSRVVGHGEVTSSKLRYERIFEYLRNTPTVRDVLISGGDPLSLGEENSTGCCRTCGPSRTSSSFASAPKCRPYCRSESPRSSAAC